MTGKYILNEHILLKASKTVIPFSPELHLDFSVSSPCTNRRQPWDIFTIAWCASCVKSKFFWKLRNKCSAGMQPVLFYFVLKHT